MALRTEKCCETAEDATLLDDAELDNIAGGRAEKDNVILTVSQKGKSNKKSGNSFQ